MARANSSPAADADPPGSQTRRSRRWRQRRVRPGQGEGLAAPAPRAGAAGRRAAGRRAPRSPPRSALAQFTREKRDRHRNLFRRRPAQQRGDLVDLGPAAETSSDTASDVRTKSLSSTYVLCPRLPTPPS